MWKLLLPPLLTAFLLLPSAVPRARAGSDAPAVLRDLVIPRDRALVCFYREPAFQGNWFDYRVADERETIGSVSAHTFFGLQKTRGSYRKLASLYHLADDDYHKFVDFLRHHDLKPDN